MYLDILVLPKIYAWGQLKKISVPCTSTSLSSIMVYVNDFNIFFKTEAQ
jgi:hypothetical protein